MCVLPLQTRTLQHAGVWFVCGVNFNRVVEYKQKGGDHHRSGGNVMGILYTVLKWFSFSFTAYLYSVP